MPRNLNLPEAQTEKFAYDVDSSNILVAFSSLLGGFSFSFHSLLL